jgi:hypothetical protein
MKAAKEQRCAVLSGSTKLKEQRTEESKSYGI